MQAVLGWLFKAALDWLYDTLRDFVARRAQDKQHHDENTARAGDDRTKQDQLTPDSTEKQRDEATDDVLSRF